MIRLLIFSIVKTKLNIAFALVNCKLLCQKPQLPAYKSYKKNINIYEKFQILQNHLQQLKKITC